MIYLNNAASSFPKPPWVSEAMSYVLNRQPGDSYRGGRGEDIFNLLRLELKELLGVDRENQIALGPNASWGLNQAILGFPLKAGDCVVSTKAEHNSVLRPLYRLQEKGIELVLTDCDADGRINPEAWKNAMEKYRPKLAVFTHASNVTGAVNDAKTLSEAAKSVGARVLLDASQTLGFIPIEAQNWGVDMLAFTGHKYLLGPQGTGGLWVNEDIYLEPQLTGGTGIKSDMHIMPREMPMHLEAGTGNEPSCAGLLAAILWQKQHPADLKAVISRTKRLSDGIKSLGGRVIEPKGTRTPVISFIFPGISVEETGFILGESCDIVCRTGLHCAPLIFSCLGIKETVRLSLSRFTSDEEIAEVLEALEAII